MLEIVKAGAEGRRPRLEWGYQLRVYPVSREFLVEALGEASPPATQEATAFCRGCATCPYVTACTDLRSGREKWEATRARRTPPSSPTLN
jgi:hypothetical protein